MRSRRRLLVLRAGSGPSNTLMRSLKAGDSSLFMAGCHHDRFEIKKSLADRNYLVPQFAQSGFRRALRKIIEAERIDLVIPTHYVDVRTVSDLRDSIPCRVFLPRATVIQRCQDKYQLTSFLGRRGVRVALTYPVNSLKDIEGLFRRFRPARELWCRIRAGSGSAGAILVKTPEQTRSWIKYWEEVCGMPAGAFTLSEYLPGRDFCVQTLWKGGRLVMARSHERLSYLVAGGGPSNVSSMAALARIIHDPRVFEVGTKAIRALDAKASGAIFVDIKENAGGDPCVTEINAGRFASVSLAHDTAGPDNMALAYVRVALGERAAIRKAPVAEDCYVLRGLDSLPAVLRADELSEGIVDLTG